MSVTWVSSVAVAQTVAGTTTLVAAPGVGKRIVFHGADLTIDGTGTLKITDSVDDLTGDFTAHGSHPGMWNIAPGCDCSLLCGENRALQIVTTNHPARGVVYYRIEQV